MHMYIYSRGRQFTFTFALPQKQELEVIEEVHGEHAFQEECPSGTTEPTARALQVGEKLGRRS
jgi:hypothetical protein